VGSRDPRQLFGYPRFDDDRAPAPAGRQPYVISLARPHLRPFLEVTRETKIASVDAPDSLCPTMIHPDGSYFIVSG
jgi:hypothetical protein